MSKQKDKTPKAVNKKELYSPNMLKTYRNDVVPSMVSRFNYENSMQVPKLLSIALNMGLGDAKTNSKKLESATKEMALITGQKPLITKSKSDISNVMLVQSGQISRLGYKILEDGSKVRVLKKTNEESEIQ